MNLGPNNASGDVFVGSSGIASPSSGNQDYGYYITHNAFRNSNGDWKHSRTTSIPSVRHLGSGGVSSGTVGFYWDYSANVGTGNITWTNLMYLNTNGNLLITNGSIKTAAPTTGTAAAWKLGSRVAAAVALDATQYIELDVGGTLYKLAIVT